MAKPIKETPVLHGKDAECFVETMNQVSEKKIKKAELKKMRESFNKLKSISVF